MYMKHCLASGRVKAYIQDRSRNPNLQSKPRFMPRCLRCHNITTNTVSPCYHFTILPFYHFIILPGGRSLDFDLRPDCLNWEPCLELILKHHFNQKWRKIKMVSTQRLSFCLKLGPVSEGNWYLNINLRRTWFSTERLWFWDLCDVIKQSDRVRGAWPQ